MQILSICVIIKRMHKAVIHLLLLGFSPRAQNRFLDPILPDQPNP